MVRTVDRRIRRYPHAERVDLVEQLHGRAVADPYRWLEDAADPRTVAWSAAQDELFASHRDGWPARERLRARLAEFLAVGMVSAPVWRGDRAFFLRRAPEQEHPVLFTAEPDGTRRVLVDPVLIDPSGTTTLDYWTPSADGSLVVYGQSTGGTEDSELRVIRTDTGELVDGPIDRVRFSATAWLPDGTAFYLTRYLPPGSMPGDDARLHRRLYLHRLGTDPEQDTMIAGEGAPRGQYIVADVSADGRWLSVIAAQGTAPRTDVWIADLSASRPDAPELRPLQVGVDARTRPVFRGGRLYVWTDRDAPRGRLCSVPPGDLSYPAWQDLIPEDPEAVLDGVAFLDGAGLDRPALLVARTRHAVSELAVHDLDGGSRRRAVGLPGTGSIATLTDRQDGGCEAWFTFTDFDTPSTVYQFDGRTGRLSEWARPPGAVDPAPKSVRQVTYRSPDGTPVRMFVVTPVREPGTQGEPKTPGEPGTSGRPEPRPTILHGYGGFDVSLTPYFSAVINSWVGAGGVYAMANLRGGGEEGEQWHRAGMLASKQNVFDDFHAAGDWLVRNGVTTPGQLAVMGGSNGGLLVGAALTQRPAAYAAAVCSAPLLDMVRYERFGLGPTWSVEYGTAEEPEQFGWLLAYSPYHNVQDSAAYPAVLFTVFEGDGRVDPLHARKLAAALQHATVGDGPILLRRESDVGHAASAVSRTIELHADQLAFLAATLGL